MIPGLGWFKRIALSFAVGSLAVLALVLTLLTFGKTQRNTGAKLARAKDQEADYEHAEDIRTRVDRDLPDRLHTYDDAGFRD